MDVFAIEGMLSRRYDSNTHAAPRPRFSFHFGGVVTRIAAVALLAAVVTGGALFAQEEFGFLGRYDDAQSITQPKEDRNEFVFTRLIYNGRIPGYIKNWYTDYPKGDQQLIWALQRMTHLSIDERERAVAITDPNLFKYPFLYTSEPGQMVLDSKDAAIMREYLLRGGFWMLDDFWGSFEWENMAFEMKKIFPDAEIRDIPLDHPLFHQFFDVDRLKQVPSYAYVVSPNHITFEQDGYEPECKGIWDKNGRLMVVINHNTDLGDAYEWMDAPEYPYEFSSYAYRIAVNTILYALSH